MTKQRQSNIELLRLVSMFMVMMCHATGYVNEADLVGVSGAAKLVLSQLCLICVNVFVMISGWFGIKASLKGVCALLFQVFFITVLCFGVCSLLGLPVSFKNHFLPYFLMGNGYWFVVSYLIMYALSPVLNRFAERASQKEFISTLALVFSAEFFYGYILGRAEYAFGFSPLAFVNLYLLAKYARLYPGKLFSFSRGKDISIYLLVTLVSIIGLWFGYRLFGMGFHLNHYDSPLAIVAALYFLLFFSKLEINSRFVNWCAASAFAIYLIHENNLVAPHYNAIFERLGTVVPAWGYYPAMMLILLVFGFVCILVDQPRKWLWAKILIIWK